MTNEELIQEMRFIINKICESKEPPICHAMVASTLSCMSGLVLLENVEELVNLNNEALRISERQLRLVKSYVLSLEEE